MTVYDFSDYKLYVIKRVSQMPGGGRGAFKRISEILEIHTSLVTHIFKGEKELTPEQAYLLGEFFGLDALESQYFVTLVSLQRATRMAYKKHLTARLESIKKMARGQSADEGDLDNVKKTIFYSNWFYSGIHLLTTIPDYETVDAISSRLNLPSSTVKQVLNFLVSAGLCENQNGKYTPKRYSTLIKDNRQFSMAHNTNWRFKAVEKLPCQKEGDFFFTNLVSLSREDAQKIKSLMKRSMDRVFPIVKKSPAETIYCLNIDWFSL